MTWACNDGYFDKSRGVYSFLNVLLRPESKGTVRLSSSDPSADLIIDPQYLTNSADLVPLRAALRLTLLIKKRMQALKYPIEDWTDWAPLPDANDAELDAYIRKNNRTTYHYSSTCRMAPEDDPNGGGVVDNELRVYGVAGLRVADSSIFPRVLATHLQAPTVVVAEKCADMVLRAYKGVT